MEAELGINITWYNDQVHATIGNKSYVEQFSKYDGDKQAARRVASLRIAAYKGRMIK